MVLVVGSEMEEFEAEHALSTSLEVAEVLMEGGPAMRVLGRKLYEALVPLADLGLRPSSKSTARRP